MGATMLFQDPASRFVFSICFCPGHGASIAMSVLQTLGLVFVFILFCSGLYREAHMDRPSLCYFVLTIFDNFQRCSFMNFVVSIFLVASRVVTEIFLVTSRVGTGDFFSCKSGCNWGFFSCKWGCKWDFCSCN